MNKPLSRRLFGKAMAAVPLAVSEAPRLAASAKMANTAGLMSGTIVQDKPWPAGTAVKPMTDDDWREERRKELQAIIDGKEPDYTQELGGTPYLAHHYDALRSVSHCAKVVFCRREEERRAKLQRISWARRELQNLVRKFF